MDANLVQLDSHHIQYPLLLRTWKKAIIFIQDVTQRSRFFLRSQTLTARKGLGTGAIKIIWWVLGVRIDDRFKIAFPPGYAAIYI
jgi:hypothetical protein